MSEKKIRKPMIKRFLLLFHPPKSRQKTGWWINSLRLIFNPLKLTHSLQSENIFFRCVHFAFFSEDCWVMADKWAKLLNIWLPGDSIDTLFIHLGPGLANTGSVRQHPQTWCQGFTTLSLHQQFVKPYKLHLLLTLPL